MGTEPENGRKVRKPPVLYRSEWHPNPAPNCKPYPSTAQPGASKVHLRWSQQHSGIGERQYQFAAEIQPARDQYLLCLKVLAKHLCQAPLDGPHYSQRVSIRQVSFTRRKVLQDQDNTPQMSTFHTSSTTAGISGRLSLRLETGYAPFELVQCFHIVDPVLK